MSSSILSLRAPARARALLLASFLVCVLAARGIGVSGEPPFVRGDGNADGVVSLADIMTVVRYLHRPENLPACADAADFNDSGHIEVSDLVGLANFVFLLTAREQLPAAPYPLAADDPTVDGLDCAQSPHDRDVEGIARAALVEEFSCGPIDYLGDSAVVNHDGFPGQIVDFVLFARSCVSVMPGQQRVRVPVFLSNTAAVEGITVSVKADPRFVRLEDFSFTGTALAEFRPELTHSSRHGVDWGFLATTVFMDFEAPFDGRAFPAQRKRVHIADLELSIAPEVKPGTVLHVEFETTPGINALRPPISNEFSVEGRSIKPGLSKRGLSLRVLRRGELFVRGDGNRDFSVDISDVVGVLGVLFQARPAPCLEALDTNDDGVLNLTDPIALANYLFLGGAPPALPYPFPAAVADASETEFSCD